MRSDPIYSDYLSQWTAAYNSLNYEKGLSACFLRKSHAWMESAFTKKNHFSRVLEVGAGTGTHINYLKHTYDMYVMTDSNVEMLNIVRNHEPFNNVSIEEQNATKLNYPNNSFDRLIATHVLEHLERPHEVLREWHRVIKPGGTISILLPCDPGIAWRFGRAIGSRSKFKKIGMEYDYWMAREHINSINNLTSLIRYYFEEINESWRPFLIPSTDVNLFYTCHITVGATY